MRSAIAATTPLPDQSFGMPKMPNRKKSRIPTIATNFQVRFLFMRKPVVRRWSLAKPESPRERPTTIDQRLFSFLRRGHRYDRRTADFKLQIIRRHAQGHRIVLEADDRPAQAAAGYDLVSVFQFAQHGLPFLLFALLRQNQQKVKNGKDEKQGRETEQTATRQLQPERQSALDDKRHARRYDFHGQVDPG